MAINRATEYPGRFDNATPQQPEGAFKNRTTEISKDGSYLEKKWLNDFSAFFSSLLDGAGVTSNGVVDSVGASQYYDSMRSIIDGESLKNAIGYQVLPSGVIMQWGVVDMTTAPTGTTSFPIAFTISAHAITMTETSSSATNSIQSAITSKSATSFTWVRGADIASFAYYIAIGS